jgi:hypothetical protein
VSHTVPLLCMKSCSPVVSWGCLCLACGALASPGLAAEATAQSDDTHGRPGFGASYFGPIETTNLWEEGDLRPGQLFMCFCRRAWLASERSCFLVVAVLSGQYDWAEV